jgi:acetyltransferase-like isoleucine patch superfamily enzyme
LTKSTEPWTIYVGSPAKPVRKRDLDLCMLGAKEMGY